MTKLVLDDVGNLNTAGLTTINSNSDKIVTALENTLSRDGTTPNQMSADLDLNHNDILNVDNLDVSGSFVLGGETVQAVDISTALKISNNLSDLDDVAEARDNLGLGTAATMDADDIVQIIDEDDMASNSSTKVPTQQSVNVAKLQKVATRTALKALSGTTHPVIYLYEDGREGIFKWDSSDLSTEVTADTQEGIYVAPTSDTTGASGAWVRQYNGFAFAEWFGAVGDGTTDDATAIKAALTVAKQVELNSKTYAVESTIRMNQHSQFLRGPARSGSIFAATSVAGAVLKWTGADDSSSLVVLGGDANTDADGDMHGGGITDLQLDGNFLVLSCLTVKAIDTACIERLKIHAPKQASGSRGLWFTANTAGVSTINAIFRCSIRDIIIVVSDVANGFYNQSNGSDGGITNCDISNIMVEHDDGIGFYISSIDTTTITNIATSRVTGGTGANIYLDGDGDSGKAVYGVIFNGVHPNIHDGTPTLVATGSHVRQCKMIVTGTDNGIKPSLSSSADLKYEYLGTGYTATDSSEGAVSRSAPIQIAGYDVSDANTLDWYVEGTYTPAVSFGGASVGITYTRQLGRYTRIGDSIIGEVDIILSSKGTSTGTLQVTTPAFTQDSTHDSPCRLLMDKVTSGVGDTMLSAKISGGTRKINFYKMASGTNTALADTDVTNTTVITVGFSYKI